MTLPLAASLLLSPVTASPPPAISDPTQIDDLHLLQQGQAGDRDAYATLLTRHESALLRLCRSMTVNVTDAEDLVQETFLRALRAFERPGGFRGDGAISTFLYRIAVNVCLDARRSRRPTVALDGYADTLRSSQPTPEQTAVNLDAVRGALAALHPRQRVLLILREQEGFSVAEIAELLGWNLKKVDNELYKTRKALAAWRERSGL